MSNKEYAVGNMETTVIGEPVVSLDMDLNDTPPIVPSVYITACNGVTHVDVLNEVGDSVIAPDRPDRSSGIYTVANYSYPDRDQWRVAVFSSVGSGPC